MHDIPTLKIGNRFDIGRYEIGTNRQDIPTLKIKNRYGPRLSVAQLVERLL